MTIARCAVVVVLAVLTLGATACSDDSSDDSQATPDTGGPPATTTTTVAEFDEIIGAQYAGDGSPLPGWTYVAGSLVESELEFGLSLWRPSPDQQVFLSERVIRRRADGVPIWRVLDVAVSSVPVDTADSYVALPGQCRDRDDADLVDTIGIAAGPDPYDNPALELWSLGRPDGQLVGTDPEGVTCRTENPD